MGKAVAKGIKSKAKQLLKLYPHELSAGFEKNKCFINSLGLPYSKHVKSLIAGFIARESCKQAS